MSDDERRDEASRFDGYLEALIGEGRPSPESVADRDEAEMARLAAELAASAQAPSGTEPDPAFVEQLRRRMREADAGITAVRTPPPVRSQAAPAGTSRWHLSRRDVQINPKQGRRPTISGVKLVDHQQRHHASPR